MLLNTWLGLPREPQERLENEAGLPKLQSLSPPSHLQTPHCSAQRQAQLGTTWGKDYLVLSGTIGDLQHLGCRRGTGGKVGLAIITAKPYRGDKFEWSTSVKGSARGVAALSSLSVTTRRAGSWHYPPEFSYHNPSPTEAVPSTLGALQG